MKIHGITDAMIANAPSLSDVQAHLQQITNSSTVYVGHNVQIDLKVLKLYECHFIDTQDFYPTGLPRKLSLLSERELNARIQEGKHSSVIDCRAALGIFLANKADTRNQRYLSRDYLLDKKALKTSIKANRKHLMGQMKENVRPIVNSQQLIESVSVASGLHGIKEHAVYKVNVTEVRQLI